MNRTFRDVIVTSPLVQHKIDLFASGLEYNPGTNTSLADSRKALAQYRSNLDSLCPIEERMVEGLHERDANPARMAGGICAIVRDGSVRLFTPGPASRGIPHKEWKIPVIPLDYCFYPCADVIAFLVLQELRFVHSFVMGINTASPFRSNSALQFKIYLRTMSDGRAHPAAQSPTIHYSRTGIGAYPNLSSSITGSRLVVAAKGNTPHTFIKIWDWKSARVLFVGQPFT